jgi:tripartite-type tricarboxylate transporter receptor subunit TctC
MRLVATMTAAAAALVLSLPAALGQSADWPVRPVKVIVPYPAGGTADMLARVIADPLSARLGQQFVIDNRAGAGGLVGSQAVAQAEPDGYTLVVSGIPSHVLAPAMNKNAPFDAMRDFTHVAYLGGPPNILMVHRSLGVKTFQEFMAHAKRQNESIGYVSPGVGTVGNLVMESLARRDSIKLEHIPYRGGNPAVQDLVAGHVKVGSMALATARPHVQTGALLPIAITSESRIREFPDLPTMKELGYADLVTTTWFSVSGPAGLPKPIVERLNREITAALARPEVRKHLDQEAVEGKPMSPDEVTRLMQSEIDKWAPVARAATADK